MRPSLLTRLPRTVGSRLADFKAPAQRIVRTGRQEASFFGRETSSCPQPTDSDHDGTSPRTRLIPLPTREVCFAQPRVRTDVCQHVIPPDCPGPAVALSEPRAWKTQLRAVPEEVWHDGIGDPRNVRVATRPRACSEGLGRHQGSGRCERSCPPRSQRRTCLRGDTPQRDRHASRLGHGKPWRRVWESVPRPAPLLPPSPARL